MPAPIIAAYDPYIEDRAPVALAVAAAALTGSPVLAASIYPWLLAEGYTAVDDFDREPTPVVTGALQRLHADLGVQTRIFRDLSVPHGLHELARDTGAVLIVVGSTDRGAVGRVLTGSTAQRLLHGAPCPVALAPRGYARTPLRTIAVGFVDTPEGHGALAAAHALAARSCARLRAIAVLHPSGGLDAAMAGGLREARAFTLEGRARHEARAALERAVEALAPGVDVHCEVHVDDPADVLLRISEHVEMLVCGSRGYGPLRSVLLGGVSRRLVDEAHCPVLVLPREAGRPLVRLLGDADTAAAR
jgi:nucleotide-binding universal stress UspA family protein